MDDGDTEGFKPEGPIYFWSIGVYGDVPAYSIIELDPEFPFYPNPKGTSSSPNELFQVNSLREILFWF